MKLTASVSLRLLEQGSTTFDEDGNLVSVTKDFNAANRLVIQPKWETPILNFKDVEVELPQIGSGSVARGMWHQYGVKPAANEGIYLQVQDLDKSEFGADNLTGSLAKLLGIDQSEKKLGTVAETKTISEAIVAIPFYREGNNIKYYKIDPGQIHIAKKFANSKNPVPNENIGKPGFPDEAIVDMVKKMQKFVIPPHLDFVHNPHFVKPMAMFILEYSVDLSEKDLTDIWQNLTPDIGRSFKVPEPQASLPVDIFRPDIQIKDQPTRMMSGLDKNTKWQVFKVKQRSAYNYFAKTAESADDTQFKFNFAFGGGTPSLVDFTNTPYSYNWPYDFFSLIELVKIDSDIQSVPKIPAGPVGNNPDTGFDVDQAPTNPDTGTDGSDKNSPKDTPGDEVAPQNQAAAAALGFESAGTSQGNADAAGDAAPANVGGTGGGSGTQFALPETSDPLGTSGPGNFTPPGGGYFGN